MKSFCYINGKIIPTEKAHISVMDLGLLRGYGVFDYLRTYNGVPFLLHEHYSRLTHSAKTLSLKISLPEKQLNEIVLKLYKKVGTDIGARIVVTGGISQDGTKRIKNNETIFIVATPVHIYPKSVYEHGAKLITHSYIRPLAEIKSLNYITMIMNEEKKQKAKALDILYEQNGVITEGTTFNFFIFKNNTLITPKDTILLGTRRNLILKLAKKYFVVKEQKVTLSDVKTATEAFITSTTREILPIVKINNQTIGNGLVGKNTKLLMELYKKEITTQIKNHLI